MEPSILVNGRVLSKPMMGVARYAREVLSRIEEMVELRTICPRKGLRGPIGHFWEQTVLPRSVGPGQILWSPANTGPLNLSRQVVTVHDASCLDHPEWFSAPFARWYRFLLPRLARKVRRVITDSEYSKERLLAHTNMPEERIVAIHLGVDERFKPATPDELEQARSVFGLERPYLLYVGSLEPRKNLAALLQAWEQVGPKLLGLELVLVGITSAVFSGRGFRSVPPRVRFLGHADDTLLPALYSGARAFVYPSLYEGFGLPPLEAMACGTPVIASNRASIPEVVGDAALVPEPTSVPAICDCILEIARNDGLAETLRQNGLRRAERFRWETCASRTATVLQGALQEE